MATQDTAAQKHQTKADRELSRRAAAEVATWWSTLAQCQHELGRFISHRLAKDSDSLRQTATCRDWTEALNVQAEWVKETMRDYSSEISKLADLYARAITEQRDELRKA
jgi:hypothetical protein